MDPHAPATPPRFPAMTIAQAHALLNQPGSPFEVAEETVRGVRMKVWKQAPPTLREVFAVSALHADREALVYERDRVTYGAYRAAAVALARQLVADGVAKGDRVVVQGTSLLNQVR